MCNCYFLEVPYHLKMSFNCLVCTCMLFEVGCDCNNTVEPLYNEVLGTMKITFKLLYRVSCYIRVKKKIIIIKSWDQQNDLVMRGFVISDLFITRFHCNCDILARQN